VNVISWPARASLFTFPKHTPESSAPPAGNVHYRLESVMYITDNAPSTSSELRLPGGRRGLSRTTEFPSARKDTVVVTLKHIPGELRLTASDDGKGIDRQRTDSVVGGGLVAMFARQLGGQVEREDRRPVEDGAWR
jgi:hypothetical protein